MKLDLRFVGGEEKWMKNEEKHEDDLPLERMKDESELDFYNRKALASIKDLIHGNYHGKTIEELKKENEEFLKEWDEVIKRDPLIGDKD